MDNNSLAHTKWECEYHLVFAPFCSLGEVGGVGQSHLKNYWQPQ